MKKQKSDMKKQKGEIGVLQKKLDDLLKTFTSKVFVLSSNLELDIETKSAKNFFFEIKSAKNFFSLNFIGKNIGKFFA